MGGLVLWGGESFLNVLDVIGYFDTTLEDTLFVYFQFFLLGGRLWSDIVDLEVGVQQFE